jgi:hypothetical protein
MKTISITLSALLVMFVSAVKAQQTLKYQVYVITTNGKVVNKTYQNVYELSRDQAIRDLDIGHLKSEEFIFTPAEGRHKAFFVETTGHKGTERHYQFHSWDEQAGSQIAKTVNIHESNISKPVQSQQKGTTDTHVPVSRGSLEEQLLQELIKDGIIKDVANVSLTLTTKAFVVNSVKQPAQVLAKYRKLTESIKGEQLSENFSLEHTRSSN